MPPVQPVKADPVFPVYVTICVPDEVTILIIPEDENNEVLTALIVA